MAQTPTHFKVLLTDYAWPDLDIERSLLEGIGAELVVAETQDEAALAELAKDCDAIMTCWANVSRPIIESAQVCQIVSRLGIGLDNIDVDYCTTRQIPVTNVPDYCVREVAEHTLALIFALGRNVARFHIDTKQGIYDLKAAPPIRRIAGQTLGIVGFGQIGTEVAKLASAVGLNVIAHSRSSKVQPDLVAYVGFDELLRTSDFVSLHVPLTEETNGIINADEFAKMKASACLVNTARGGLVDHGALANALRDDLIAGAALDVQQPEPPDMTQMPFCDPRVIVTPHAAFVSTESLESLRRRATQQVVDRLLGEVPAHVVNPSVLS